MPPSGMPRVGREIGNEWQAEFPEKSTIVRADRDQDLGEHRAQDAKLAVDDPRAVDDEE